jgi:LCP family protein required for cell wall assembly
MAKKSFYKQSAKVDSSLTSTVLEIDKPSRFTQSIDAKPMLQVVRSKWSLWILSAGLGLLLIVVVTACLVGFWYFRSVEKYSHTTFSPLLTSFISKRNELIIPNGGYKTFLLLGLDQSLNQREMSLLTDTMIFAVIHDNGEVNVVSLPRDIWVDSLKTKINALYYYGQQTNPDDGVTLVSSVITEMTGYPVDYTYLINMDTLKSIINAVGGVDISVVRAFTDMLYPREVDLTSKDPSVLYETVSFEAGPQHMDGDRALIFIRSRHSQDELEGTDVGREQRQQLLITALKQKLMDPMTYSNPQVLASLYSVWKSNVRTTMSDVDLLLLAKQLALSRLSITSYSIPIETASESGLIYHPKVGPSNQWIYAPKDSSWGELKNWFSSRL